MREASLFCDSKEKFRPKLVSVKRSERGERSEDLLFERSEFQIFSEPRERSSEAGSALNFWLLFFQEKSNNNKKKRTIFAANINTLKQKER